VRRWDGTNWLAPNGSSDPDAGPLPEPSDSISMALAGSDPLIARQGTSDVFLRAWTGTAWGEIAGSASDGGVSNSVALSTNPKVATTKGLVCMAWEERGKIVARCAHR
jgi:hypothetical protein